jgi:hypothetical protein
MRQALADPAPLGDALPGGALVELTHVAHRQLGEELMAAERETGREREPGEMVEVFLCVAGRRSGKSRAC